MRKGEDVILTGIVEGADDYTVTYQWEVDRGEGFEPIEGATESEYRFPASMESLQWSWRLVVYVSE